MHAGNGPNTTTVLIYFAGRKTPIFRQRCRFRSSCTARMWGSLSQPGRSMRTRKIYQQVSTTIIPVTINILIIGRKFDSNLYHAVIGFTCIDFLPQNTGSFLTKVFHQHFVNRRPIKQAIRTFLFEETSMGAHSDLIVYYGRIPFDAKGKKLTELAGKRTWVVYRYSWAHHAMRPFTVTRPIQCLECRRIHTIEGNAHVDKVNNKKHVVVTLLCSACGAFTTHTMSSGLCALEDSRSLTSVVDIPNWSCKTRGEWCYEVVEPAEELV